MKIKKIKKLKVNSTEFKVLWVNDYGGSFDYGSREIRISKNATPSEQLEIINHELLEICACEMHVRYNRTDCRNDYLFSYDHKQHTTLVNMFSALQSQFLM